MESTGVPARIQISAASAKLIGDAGTHVLEYRGKVAAKGKGEVDTYWVSASCTPRLPSGLASLGRGAGGVRLGSSRRLALTRRALPRPAHAPQLCGRCDGEISVLAPSSTHGSDQPSEMDNDMDVVDAMIAQCASQQLNHAVSNTTGDVVVRAAPRLPEPPAAPARSRGTLLFSSPTLKPAARPALLQHRSVSVENIQEEDPSASSRRVDSAAGAASGDPASDEARGANGGVPANGAAGNGAAAIQPATSGSAGSAAAAGAAKAKQEKGGGGDG